MRIPAALMALFLGLGITEPALAGAPLTDRVYDPWVRNGLTEVEIRTGRVIGGADGGETATVVEIERGLNDRMSLALLAEIEDEPGDSRTVEALAVESVIYLGQIPHTGVDAGLYLEYEQRIHNESGVGEAKLLLARRFGPVQGLLNLVAEQAFTDRSGEGAMAFGYAAQATVETAHHLQLGLQAFGDLGTSRGLGGRQGHYLGPVVSWETRPAGFPGEIGFEAAYLLPLGAAREDADGDLRLMLEFERRF